ncbi:MAG: hypothetical protein LWW85_06525, partial [Marinilabiliales bacterium]|nr:hypothetical protein [Marinilabiliales bacterium]
MKKYCLLLFWGLSIPAIGQTLYIGHRGNSSIAPENTIASAKSAWEAGADGVELDVYLSADEKLMVIHDSHTQRTCPGQHDFEIAKTMSDTLRTLDAGMWKDKAFQHEKIPFLEEILATVPPDRMLVVEIKCGTEILPIL